MTCVGVTFHTSVSLIAYGPAPAVRGSTKRKIRHNKDNYKDGLDDNIQPSLGACLTIR